MSEFVLSFSFPRLIAFLGDSDIEILPTSPMHSLVVNADNNPWPPRSTLPLIKRMASGILRRLMIILPHTWPTVALAKLFNDLCELLQAESFPKLQEVLLHHPLERLDIVDWADSLSDFFVPLTDRGVRVAEVSLRKATRLARRWEREATLTQ